MSIVKMKRLIAIAPIECRQNLLREFYKLGCVELESISQEVLSNYGQILRTRGESNDASYDKASLHDAIAALDRYAPVKTSIFAPRTPITEGQLFHPLTLKKALETARLIEGFSDKIEENTTTRNRLQNKVEALTPWRTTTVPVEYTGTKSVRVLFGVLPASVELDPLREKLYEQCDCCRLDSVSDDREQHYISLIVHRSQEEAALSLLKTRGLTIAMTKVMTGKVADNIALLEQRIARLEEDNRRLVAEIIALAGHRTELKAAADAYTQISDCHQFLTTVGYTGKTVYLTGWVPSYAEKEVGDILTEFGCAWQLQDPSPEEEAPILYRNNRFVDPFVGITEMYGTPTYHSLIDPNPLMSIFYFVFFGFIMGDAMYGVLITLGCWLVLKKKRPAGSMKRTLTMFMYCGVATFFAGALTGGWFADSVSAISFWLTGNTISIPPIWFDPLSNPMQMLTFSLVLGAIQMFTGMALTAYRMILQGRWMDAVLDIGVWYVVFTGIGLFVLGIPAGSYLMGAGVLIILFTAGRNNKGLGKITGGLGALYGSTGYISDLLSYSRIMALGLSGAVVGQVINKIATMATGIPGAILFLLVFTGGHIFNVSINLLGAYVHTSRLQYIEFFGRFFEDGGRPFRPLLNNTKYVEIVRED